MRLLIVIVNYRTAGLTVDCLRSVAPQIAPDMRVVITDNLSGDDSVETHRPRDRRRTTGIGRRVMPNSIATADLPPATTRRFARRLPPPIHPNFMLLLNPDTVLRERASVELMEFIDAHPEVGIAGSRLEDPDGTPQISAFRFHSIASEFERGMRLGPVTKLLASKDRRPARADQPKSKPTGSPARA